MRYNKGVTYERNESIKIAEYRDWKSNQNPEWALLHTTPNGGFRHPKVAAFMKNEGAQPGVPDFEWMIPSAGYTGLFMELKVGHRKPSPAQNAFLEIEAALGYFCSWVTSSDEAIRVLDWYHSKMVLSEEQIRLCQVYRDAIREQRGDHKKNW